MNCLIVDDDKFSRDILKKFVQQTKPLNLVKACSNGIEARNILFDEKIDLVLLDIEMPELSGIDLIKTLNQAPLIILVTTHDEFAIEAFEYDVLDYIVKPFNYARFLKAISKAEQIGSSSIQAMPSSSNIFVKVDKKTFQINTSEIFLFEAFGNYVKIHTNNKTYLHHSSLREIKTKLDQKEFIQVHRSYLIRIDKIEQIEDDVIKINENLIPVGHNYKKELNMALNWL